MTVSKRTAVTVGYAADYDAAAAVDNADDSDSVNERPHLGRMAVVEGNLLQRLHALTNRRRMLPL